MCHFNNYECCHAGEYCLFLLSLACITYLNPAFVVSHGCSLHVWSLNRALTV